MRVRGGLRGLASSRISITAPSGSVEAPLRARPALGASGCALRRAPRPPRPPSATSSVCPGLTRSPRSVRVRFVRTTVPGGTGMRSALTGGATRTRLRSPTGIGAAVPSIPRRAVHFALSRRCSRLSHSMSCGVMRMRRGGREQKTESGARSARQEGEKRSNSWIWAIFVSLSSHAVDPWRRHIRAASLYRKRLRHRNNPRCRSHARHSAKRPQAGRKREWAANRNARRRAARRPPCPRPRALPGAAR